MSSEKKVGVEFVELLQSGASRNTINKFKEKNWLRDEDKYIKDVDCIYYLLYENTTIHQRLSNREILFKYIDYIDKEDPFNSSVKWIKGGKKKFLDDFIYITALLI